MAARFRFALALIVLGVIVLAILLPAVPDPLTALRAWEASLAILFSIAAFATLCVGRLSLMCYWGRPGPELPIIAGGKRESWSIPLLC